MPGLTNEAIPSEAVFSECAWASCLVGTTRGSAASWAMLKKTRALPWMKAVAVGAAPVVAAVEVFKARQGTAGRPRATCGTLAAHVPPVDCGLRAFDWV